MSFIQSLPVGGALWVLFSVGLVGCSDDAASSSSNVDLGVADVGSIKSDAGGPVFSVEPPVLTPCPAGWEEREDARLGIAACEPWPDSSPVQWDCPQGWRRVIEGGVEACAPFPNEQPADCQDFESHFPGDPGCAVVGTECPVGAFPDDLPNGANIVFVQSGFRDGDGSSPESPLGSLYEVNFPALPNGSIVALAKGTHRWTGTLNRFVTLWGACTAETFIVPPSPLPANPPAAVITVSTTGLGANRRVVVKSLTVADAPQVGLLVSGRLRLGLEGVVVRRTEGFGLAAIEGGHLDGSEVVVRDTQPRTPGFFGRGLEVNSGATADIRRAVFEGNRDVGVLVTGADSRVVLEDVLVQDTQSQALSRTLGAGLIVERGAVAEVRRAAFTRNREAALLAFDPNTRLVVEDAVVLDTRSREAGRDLGRGLSVVLGASAEVRRALFLSNRVDAILAEDSGTHLVAENVVIRDTRGQEADLTGGRGLRINAGAEAEVRAAVLELSRQVGVLVSGANTRLAIEDGLIRGTMSQEADKLAGVGLQVVEGATAEVRRTLLEGNRAVGILATTGGAKLHLEDAVVRDTLAREIDGRGGRGLIVQEGAEADISRAVFERNHQIGVDVASANSRLFLDDSVVRDTLSEESSGLWGRGMTVQDGASAEVRRSIFDRNRETGIYVAFANARLVLEDTRIRNTLSAEASGTGGRGLNVQDGATAEVRRGVFERNQDFGVFVSRAAARISESLIDEVSFPPCAEAPIPCQTFAVGVMAGGEAGTILMDRTRVSRAEQCGVFVFADGQLDGTDVVLAENGVGACFEDSDYDPSRLGAEYIDNRERFTFQSFPPAPERLIPIGRP